MIFVGIVGTYVISMILAYVWTSITEKVPTIKKYTSYLSPVVALGIIISVIVYAYSFITKEPVTIIHILTILSISIIGGVAFARFVKNKND